MARNSTTIMGTRFIFRVNLSGAPDRFNPNGARPNCNITIPSDLVPSLREQGYNVRELAPREGCPEDASTYTLKLNCSFGGMSDPRIVVLSGDPEDDPRTMDRAVLTRETIGIIDFADVWNVDVTFNPYYYGSGDKASAYIEKMYVCVRPDDIDRKYGIGGEADGTE